MSTAATPVSAPPLQWSHWYPCGPGFDVSHVPEVAGLCVIGHREDSGFSVVHIEAACDLQQSFRRLFDADSPVYAQLQEAGCMMRYVPIAQLRVRTEMLWQIEEWMFGRRTGPLPIVVEQLLSGDVFRG